MTVQLVYITVGSPAEAHRIASSLVEARIVACANLIEGMKSVYRWQDRVCRDEETILIVKTTTDRIDRLKEVVCSLHSYECPCIVCLPVSDGHEPFLQWVAAEVQ
jgi:periplasmic divalent cation tolerance protein